MKEKTTSLRSELGKARGMGAAKSGTEHWLAQRLTALALIPLTLYLLYGFVCHVVQDGYSGAMYWLQSPYVASCCIMMLLAGLKHGALGLHVVIEDYIHGSATKYGALFVVKFVSIALAILGTLCIAKIFFGV